MTMQQASRPNPSLRGSARQRPKGRDGRYSGLFPDAPLPGLRDYSLRRARHKTPQTHWGALEFYTCFATGDFGLSGPRVTQASNATFLPCNLQTPGHFAGNAGREDLLPDGAVGTEQLANTRHDIANEASRQRQETLGSSPKSIIKDTAPSPAVTVFPIRVEIPFCAASKKEGLLAKREALAAVSGAAADGD